MKDKPNVCFSVSSSFGLLFKHLLVCFILITGLLLIKVCAGVIDLISLISLHSSFCLVKERILLVPVKSFGNRERCRKLSLWKRFLILIPKTLNVESRWNSHRAPLRLDTDTRDVCKPGNAQVNTREFLSPVHYLSGKNLRNPQSLYF
jgi:hypothetical protein